MSMHKTPLKPTEESGLRAHGLAIGTPSQLSDVFRQGLAYGVEAMCAAIKAADDKASEGDYMLDSDDCISVIRGTWKGDA